MKHLDPMKEINNDIYLNDVALKMRYSLLKLNKKNERTKTETGTHWLKFKPYPVVDDDIKHNYIVQGNSTVNNINRKNTEVFNQIHKTELKKKLNSINQTAALSYELTGDRNRRLYHDKIQTSVYFHSNPYSKSGNNTLRIYQKKSLKNQFINSIPFKSYRIKSVPLVYISSVKHLSRLLGMLNLRDDVQKLKKEKKRSINMVKV